MNGVDNSIHGGKRGLPPTGPLAAASCILWVGAVPYEWDEETIKSVVCGSGNIVDVRVLFDSPVKNKGFCFIEYETPYDAVRAKRLISKIAIKALNGTKRLRVEISKDPPKWTDPALHERPIMQLNRGKLPENVKLPWEMTTASEGISSKNGDFNTHPGMKRTWSKRRGAKRGRGRPFTNISQVFHVNNLNHQPIQSGNSRFSNKVDIEEYSYPENKQYEDLFAQTDSRGSNKTIDLFPPVNVHHKGNDENLFANRVSREQDDDLFANRIESGANDVLFPLANSSSIPLSDQAGSVVNDKSDNDPSEANPNIDVDSCSKHDELKQPLYNHNQVQTDEINQAKHTHDATQAKQTHAGHGPLKPDIIICNNNSPLGIQDQIKTAELRIMLKLKGWLSKCKLEPQEDIPQTILAKYLSESSTSWLGDICRFLFLNYNKLRIFQEQDPEYNTKSSLFQFYLLTFSQGRAKYLDNEIHEKFFHIFLSILSTYKRVYNEIQYGYNFKIPFGIDVDTFAEHILNTKEDEERLQEMRRIEAIYNSGEMTHDSHLAVTGKPSPILAQIPLPPPLTPPPPSSTPPLPHPPSRQPSRSLVLPPPPPPPPPPPLPPQEEIDSSSDEFNQSRKLEPLVSSLKETKNSEIRGVLKDTVVVGAGEVLPDYDEVSHIDESQTKRRKTTTQIESDDSFEPEAENAKIAEESVGNDPTKVISNTKESERANDHPTKSSNFPYLQNRNGSIDSTNGAQPHTSPDLNLEKSLEESFRTTLKRIQSPQDEQEVLIIQARKERQRKKNKELLKQFNKNQTEVRRHGEVRRFKESCRDNHDDTRVTRRHSDEHIGEKSPVHTRTPPVNEMSSKRALSMRRSTSHKEGKEKEMLKHRPFGNEISSRHSEKSPDAGISNEYEKEKNRNEEKSQEVIVIHDVKLTIQQNSKSPDAINESPQTVENAHDDDMDDSLIETSSEIFEQQKQKRKGIVIDLSTNNELGIVQNEETDDVNAVIAPVETGNEISDKLSNKLDDLLHETENMTQNEKIRNQATYEQSGSEENVTNEELQKKATSDKEDRSYTVELVVCQDDASVQETEQINPISGDTSEPSCGKATDGSTSLNTVRVTLSPQVHDNNEIVGDVDQNRIDEVSQHQQSSTERNEEATSSKHQIGQLEQAGQPQEGRSETVIAVEKLRDQSEKENIQALEGYGQELTDFFSFSQQGSQPLFVAPPAQQHQQAHVVDQQRKSSGIEQQLQEIREAQLQEHEKQHVDMVSEEKERLARVHMVQAQISQSQRVAAAQKQTQKEYERLQQEFSVKASEAAKDLQRQIELVNFKQKQYLEELTKRARAEIDQIKEKHQAYMKSLKNSYLSQAVTINAASRNTGNQAPLPTFNLIPQYNQFSSDNNISMCWHSGQTNLQSYSVVPPQQNALNQQTSPNNTSLVQQQSPTFGSFVLPSRDVMMQPTARSASQLPQQNLPRLPQEGAPNSQTSGKLSYLEKRYRYDSSNVGTSRLSTRTSFAPRRSPTKREVVDVYIPPEIHTLLNSSK
ncbi:uncharacterized protein SPAPADRAFT_65646 [Spathaspora passalidarum NRRL Y-27907]|uniref:RRM domain-containing protein n=1 Tax=Spathaspora passalidarum (strain NRRL Y-27907 / 11-Y1) TaxID=619300 RepID=G3AJ04_SPAPN|nr:uncharacterized protein SPAPADRAFT_65646 [Spathaspora passalidarum NRRL Y-27907]EGW34516.1 hypothetical protein SPAPADRAFT_65646 [Spathaspora passalidarum NRRL Y-27907]